MPVLYRTRDHPQRAIRYTNCGKKNLFSNALPQKKFIMPRKLHDSSSYLISYMDVFIIDNKGGHMCTMYFNIQLTVDKFKIL